jgi:hypothetical protein
MICYHRGGAHVIWRRRHPRLNVSAAGRRNIVRSKCSCRLFSSKDGTEPLVKIGGLIWRIWLRIEL